MYDVPERRWPVAAQIAAVWLAGVLGFVVSGWLVLLGFFARSAGLVAIGLIGPWLMFYAVGAIARRASPMTRRALPRVGWTSLVTIVGATGAVFYLTVAEASDPAVLSGWPAASGVGLPFALVAAMLARGRALRFAAAGVTIALVALGIWLPTTLPADDAASRVAYAQPPGGVVLIALPAGYQFPNLTVRDGAAVLDYTLDGPDGPLSAGPRLVTRPATGRSEDLVYQRTTVDHVYTRRMGEVEVVAVASSIAEADRVREFVLSVRPATDDEVMRLLPRDPGRRDRDVPAQFGRTMARLLG